MLLRMETDDTDTHTFITLGEAVAAALRNIDRVRKKEAPGARMERSSRGQLTARRREERSGCGISRPKGVGAGRWVAT